MKVKLKDGVHLSSMDNYSGLSHEDWLALEQGETVEFKEINKFIKDKVEIVGANKQPNVKESK